MMSFARKLVIISSLVIAIWLVVGVLIYKRSSSNFFSDFAKVGFVHPETVNDEITACKAKGQKLSPTFWRKVNLHRKDVPESLNTLASSITVHSNYTIVQNSKVRYLHAVPRLNKNLSVLLLHGQSFTSETWKKLNTVQSLAAFGYYSVAIDLPSFGYTPKIQNLNRAEFLRELISKLKLENVVIVSPSMSGSFSLEFLLTHHSKVAGFIPVSPIGTNILKNSPCKGPLNYTNLHLDQNCTKVWPYLKSNPPILSCIKVPTLVVFGERDKSKSSARLCVLPNSQGAEIPNGQHAAYLSDPKLWHRLLYNFLDVLSETLPCS